MNHGRLKTKHGRAPVLLRAAKGQVVSHCRSPESTSDPFRIGPLSLDTAKRWHERGIKQECDGRFRDAVQCYYAALRIAGSDAQIVFDLAYALATVGQCGAAIERYRQVIEIDPARQDAWINLGVLQAECGETDSAIESLRQAVRLDPCDAAAHYDLGDLLDLAEHPDAAAHWQAYLELASGPPEHLQFARERLQQLLVIRS